MSLALVRRALVAGGLSGYERPYPPYPAYPPSTAADRRTLILPPMAVAINGIGYSIEEETEIDVANDSAWDRTAIATTWAATHAYVAGAQIRPTAPNNYVYECTTPGTSGGSAPAWGTTPGGTTSDGTAVWTCYQDRTIAANRAGQNFNIFACVPVSGKIPTFILSTSSSAPTGFSSIASRKIGQFHCECVAVGTIGGHALTGYLAGDILPRSLQDLKHRPKAGFIGSVVWGGPTEFDTINYSPVWKAIYMASGTGASVASVFGAAASTIRDWNAFVSDFGLIGCRMMRDHEFQVLATGIEEEVNITGSANPTTTGGHVSTTGRRMISNIGSEDDAGVWWQWLDEQSYRFEAAANHTHQVVVSGDPQTVTTGNPSGDVAPTWAWYNLPGTVGSLYKQGTYGDVKLLSGGYWANATDCGSQARYAYSSRWITTSSLGSRFVAEPQ